MPTLSGSTVITRLAASTAVDVTGGPEDVGDLRWWNVNAPQNQSGWMVEAFGGETWLVPIGWTDQMEPLPTAVPTATPVPEATATLEATAAVTPTLEPTATPEITATAAPDVTPTATLEGEVPSPTVGGRAQVMTRFEFINLRSAPGLASETIGQLDDGTIVTILDGPEEADDIRWWQVEDEEGNVGWAAERVASEVFLVPID
jgi:hypothetical protein